VAVITTIIDALRRLGAATQKTAIQRQDEQLKGMKVIERRRHVARSELGTSAQFVATTEPVPETVVPLTNDELTPIIENAALIGSFVEAFLGRPIGTDLLEDMDAAFGAWMESQDRGGYIDEAVVEIAGAAFGAMCVDNLDMRWVRVDDHLGTAIAVQGRAKDFRGFPYAAISKRIPLGEYGFFKGIYISLQDAADRDWAVPGAT
jgi:Domain of unknown function (DUF3806)